MHVAHMDDDLVFRDRLWVIVVYRFDQVGEAVGGSALMPGSRCW